MRTGRLFAALATTVFAVAVNPAWADEGAVATDAQSSGTADKQPVESKKDEKKKPDWQLVPRWRFQYDVADINGPAGLRGTGESSEIRRAQLGVDLKMPGGFDARIEGEFTDDPITLVDTYVRWRGDGVSVVAGQQKTFSSLDDMTSDVNTSFSERAAFVTAFNYTRRLGLSGGYAKGDFSVTGGVFTEPLIQLNDVKTNSIGFDLRAGWAPKLGDTKAHLGASYHWRDRKDMTAVTLRYRQRPLVHSTDTRYISTPAMTVEKEQSYGLEAAAVNGRFHVAGEMHWMKASRPGLTNPTFFGGYAEAGVFLTKDSRPFKGGAFDAIKPKKPLGDGGIGAVQLNARYDHLDLSDAGITGGKQDAYMASLIWTPIENLRLLLEYARIDYSDAVIAVGADRDYSVDVFGLRGQVTF